MQPYQPKGLKLLETGIEALEKGFYGVKFDAIQCYFAPKQNRLIAELTVANTNEKKCVAAHLQNNTEDQEKLLDLLENQLADEIKIYFALQKWLEVVPSYVKENLDDEDLKEEKFD